MHLGAVSPNKHLTGLTSPFMLWRHVCRSAPAIKILNKRTSCPWQCWILDECNETNISDVYNTWKCSDVSLTLRLISVWIPLSLLIQRSAIMKVRLNPAAAGSACTSTNGNFKSRSAPWPAHFHTWPWVLPYFPSCCAAGMGGSAGTCLWQTSAFTPTLVSWGRLPGSQVTYANPRFLWHRQPSKSTKPRGT